MHQRGRSQWREHSNLNWGHKTIFLPNLHHHLSSSCGPYSDSWTLMFVNKIMHPDGFDRLCIFKLTTNTNQFTPTCTPHHMSIKTRGYCNNTKHAHKLKLHYPTKTWLVKLKHHPWQGISNLLGCLVQHPWKRITSYCSADLITYQPQSCQQSGRP